MLREYQHASVDLSYQSLLVHDSTVLVSPTGSGKTVMYAHIADLAQQKKKRVLIMEPRQELIKQASEKLLARGVPHGIIWASTPMSPRALVQVASVQTIARRLHKIPFDFDLLIADEAHLSIAKEYAKVLRHYQARGAKLLGVTATPIRGDGRGLSELYQDMVLGPTYSELREGGWLSDYVCFVPPSKVDTAGLHVRGGDYCKDELEERTNKAAITGDAIEHYQRICPGAKAIAFCVTVQHAKDVAAAFRAAGIAAECIDGTLSDTDRAAMLQRFRMGVTRVLCSCELISVGFDCPDAEAAILLRLTQSLALHLQQLGRVLRPGVGKIAYIIDHVGNCLNLGLPDSEYEWSLMGGKKNTAPVVQQCPFCYFTWKGRKSECPACKQYVGPVIGAAGGGREIETVEGQLVLLGDKQVAKALARQQKESEALRRKAEQKACQTFDDYVELGKARQYSSPELWAAKMMDLKHGYRRKTG